MHKFEPIENHAIIGDLNTVALVALDGTIDFLCFPRFDSPTIFASLLDPKRGGSFQIEAKLDGAKHRQLYLPDSNILLTRSLASSGVAEVSDFMPVEDADVDLGCDAGGYVTESFKRTLNFWRDWIGHCRYTGRWREIVNRSALTLKLLVSRPHGSLVAAPTFGLPEAIGGARNWDYRYTWIRDASFTIYALMRLGYTEEAAAFNHWIEERCRELKPDGSLQIMYGIDGEHEISEQILTNLRGHRGSAPVRICNAAYSQLHLDIHGELVDSVYLYDKWGRPISHDLWQDLVRLINWVARNWQQPDQGIWEVRGGPQEFLYSRVMCWVAIDRGIRLARKRSFPAPLGEWIRVRDTIYEDVFKNFWNEDLKAFVQYKGSSTLDAACLLIPLVKFISAIDPRWLSTLRAVNRVLVEESLVHRYRIGVAAPDGLPGTEGTFCMCTFWLSECLARGGDVQQGRFIFEKMLGYANHLGLYAEELGAEGEHLGNFPQAFTHLSLISAAYALDRELQNAGRT